MSGDLLAIRLSLVGYALSLGLQAMSMAGLNNQLLIYALSIAAIATFLVALFWPALVRQSATLASVEQFVDRMIGRRFLAIVVVTCAFLPALRPAIRLAETRPSAALTRDTNSNLSAPSLLQTFQENCSNYFTLFGKPSFVLDSGGEGRSHVIYAQECLDPYSRTKSYAFYVPNSSDDEQVIREIPKRYQKIFKDIEANHPVQLWELGDNESVNSYQLIFSGWIDVYHERRFPLEDVKSLEQAFRNAGVEVRFWGAD